MNSSNRPPPDFFGLQERLFYRAAKRSQSSSYIRPQMNSQCAAISFRKNLKVTASLRRFYDPECVFLLRHGNIDFVIASDLEKHAGVGPTLIGLTCGMLETRTEFRTGGYAFLVTNGVTDRLQGRLMRFI